MLETKKVNNWLCSFQEEVINVIIIVIINRPRTKHNDGGRPIAIGQLTDLRDLKTNKIKKSCQHYNTHTYRYAHIQSLQVCMDAWMQLVKLVDWLMGVTSVTNIYNTLNQGQNAKYKIDFF